MSFDALTSEQPAAVDVTWRDLGFALCKHLVPLVGTTEPLGKDVLGLILDAAAQLQGWNAC